MKREFDYFPSKIVNSLIVERFTTLITKLPTYTYGQLLRGEVPDVFSKEVRDKIDILKSQKKNHLISALMTEVQLANKFSEFLQKKPKKCISCWLGNNDCICDKMKGVDMGKRLKLHIYMHPKEVFRTTNSAKMCFSSIVDSQLYFDSFIPHMNDLDEVLKKEDTLILFPKKEALTIKEYMEVNSEVLREKTSPVNIILVDGTYNNVSSMVRNISKKYPKLSFIKLNEGFKTSEFKLRKQVKERENEGKICSAEAVAYAIEQFHGGNDAGVEMRKNILENLNIMQKAVQRISGK